MNRVEMQGGMSVSTPRSSPTEIHQEPSFKQPLPCQGRAELQKLVRLRLCLAKVLVVAPIAYRL